MSSLIKIILCMTVFGLAIYFYIDAHNRLIHLQLAIPPMQKKLREVEAENARLQYEIDRFESPSHLIEMAQHPEFSHLKQPDQHEIIIIPVKENAAY